MNSLLRTAALIALAGGLLTGPNAVAAPDVPHDGAHFVHLGHPQPVRAVGHREAVEFFWYDCVHSHQLEAPLEQWAARHSSDVTLRRVPAVWPGGPAEQVQLAHARLYYTLERLGEVDHLQLAVFRAVRGQKADLTTEELATAWAQRQGLDAAKFRAAYRSPEVDRSAKGAADLLVRYRVSEVPTVVVEGGDRTSPSKAGGVEQMPAVMDDLVARH
ncbi:thiol:disulfide interchange protein DsbA/DsbL [Kitasatospora sp. GP82]|uniref:thiol:disulfide interchange protein DsbA/DsbL n=1 Tax=Kitasatospora sp. GP82 TaxID=3035089 RepID=UPI002473A4AD|nr:thiol:disulfide interchange protein DsbA/DsbL [Kitasatospora sp. GP82]MDH6128186.1 thiol:disulfide interchange protein DsbA [Kitasatospora sp. GP82]